MFDTSKRAVALAAGALCFMLFSLSGCLDDPGQEGCTPGDRRCGDDGNIEECLSDGSAFRSKQLCINGQVCAKQDGLFQCIDNTCVPNKRFCRDDDVWSCNAAGVPTGLYTDCAEGQTCAVQAGVAVCVDAATCTADERRCAGDGLGVEVCRADGAGFTRESSCDAGQACTTASGQAACTQAACTPGEGRCEGLSVERCKLDGSGFEVEQTCDADAQCVVTDGKSYCAPTSCQRNVRFCYDNNVWECSSASTPSRVYQACGDGYVCTRDAGVATCAQGDPEPCTPNETRCAADNKSIEVCRVDGANFKTQTSCTGEQRCQEVQGALACADELCTPNETRCAADGTGLERCNTNGIGFRRVSTCLPDERCQVLAGQSQCASTIDCTPDEQFCLNNQIWSCDSVGKPDEVVKSCGTRTCGEVLGKLVCISPEGPCTPGQTRCLPPAVVGTDIREQCANDGSGFATIPSCPVASPRCVELEPGDAICAAHACSIGSTRCSADGKTVERCNTDRTGFAVVQQCGATEECGLQNAFLTCLDVSQRCQPGQGTCLGDVLQLCNSLGTGYYNASNCDAQNKDCAQIGDRASCVSRQVCTPGEQRCDPTNTSRIQACKADGTAFETLQTCGSPAQCTPSGSQYICYAPTPVCDAGRFFCDGDTLEYCAADGLSATPVQDCAANSQRCAQSASSAQCATVTQTCTPNSEQCSADGEHVLTCNANGSAFTQRDCAATERCQLANGQPACVAAPQLCTPYASSCDGAVVKICNASGTGTVTIQDCSATGRSCVINNNVAQCNAPATQLCNAGEQRCRPQDPRYIEVCAADGLSFEIASVCASPQACALSNGQPTCQTPAQLCSPASSFCDGDVLKSCNASGTASSTVQDCASTGRTCSLINGAAQCYAPPAQVCTAGQQQCSAGGTQVLVCKVDGSGFQLQTSCASGQSCQINNGQYSCVAPAPLCTPSTTFCDGDVVKSCNASGTATSTIQSCASTNRACGLINGTAQCLNPQVCSPGETRCNEDGDGIEVCNVSGSGFQSQSSCTNGQTCQATNGSPACAADPGAICTPGVRSCFGDVIVSCNGDGRGYSTIQNCANIGRRVCALSGGAPVCVTPTLTCQDGYQQLGSSCVDIDECGDGSAICGALCVNTDGGYNCVSSVSDPASPYWSESCTLSQQLNDPTELEADCRCNTNKALTGGIAVCWRPFEAYSRWPSPFGTGPRVGAHAQAHIYGGFFDAQAREIVAVVDWSDATNPDGGFVMAFNVDTGNRRIVSGRYRDVATGDKDKGTGYAFANVQDVQRGPDGKLYVMMGTLQGTEIVRVEPSTGNRTLVWRRDDVAYGQCASGRNAVSVQTHSEAFTMDAQGNFFLGFTNTSPVGEGVGVIKINAAGTQCSFVTRSGSLGSNQYTGQPVGGGWTITSGTLRGFSIQGNELMALNQFDNALYGINLTTGDRRRVSVAATSGTLGTGPTGASGMGQRWVKYDANRQVFWAVGRPGDTQIILVEPNTGNRHDLDCPSTMSTFAGVGCILGSLDTGLSLGYGGFWFDPADQNIVYFAHDSLGIVKLEVDTGNSINISL